MQFTTRKRRSAPAVMIVSLIDILMVLLIFLMISTTFTKLPSLKITLPESNEAVEGATKGKLIITVWTNEPYFFLADEPVTLEELDEQLEQRFSENPELQIGIRPDTDSASGRLIEVFDIAYRLNIPFTLLVDAAED